MASDRASRTHRVWGIFGLAAHRLGARLRGPGRGRVLLTVVSVALAIAMLVVVAGLAVGMATEGTIPAAGGTSMVVPDAVDGSPVATLDNPQFGEAHDGAARMAAHEGVTGVSPILVDVRTVETPAGDRTRVLVLGVIADPGLDGIAGIPMDGLDPDQPYVAADRDPAAWSGEAVVSPGAAEVLDLAAGDPLPLATDHDFTVSVVADGEPTRTLAGTPVALVHLGELQAVLDMERHDQAHQFLVAADGSDAEAHVASVYPATTVVSQTGFTAGAVAAGGTPTALFGLAVVVAIVVGALFTITAAGLEVTAEGPQLATMGAIGFSAWTRFGLLTVQTLLLSLVGGFAGIALGFVGIGLVNRGLAVTDVGRPIAVAEPWLAPVGLAVALAIGLVTLPTLVPFANRLSLREALR